MDRGVLCDGVQIEILNGLDPDATISVYRCGPMVDLCTGPHIPNTDLIKVVLLHIRDSHWAMPCAL